MIAPKAFHRFTTGRPVRQVAQLRALKRLSFLVQLLRFSEARAYYLRSNERERMGSSSVAGATDVGEVSNVRPLCLGGLAQATKTQKSGGPDHAVSGSG